MKRTVYTVGSLIILLICAFVFVLLPAMVGRGGNMESPVFGKYAGKSIRYEQGSEMFNIVSETAQLYQQNNIEITSSIYQQIFSYAFSETISKMASERALKKSGWAVPDSAVNRKMIPYFSENGVYSQKLYNQTPNDRILELRKQIQRDLTATRYSDDNFGSETDFIGTEALYGLKVSEAELDFLASYGNKKREFDVAVFNKSNYPDSEKVAFGKANSDKFIKYNMLVITTEDESTMKKLVTRISNGEITFEDAVSEYSSKYYSNSEGVLNSSYAYQLDNIISDAGDAAIVKALAVGETSKPVKTSRGYSIFLANAESEAPNFEDDAIIRTIYSYLVSYESSIIENYYLSCANDFVANATLNGFDKACNELSVTKVHLPAFALNYGNTSITSTLNTSENGLAYADTNENFLKKAFSLKMKEFSEPIVMGNSVVVLQFTSEDQSEGEENVISEIPSYDREAASNSILNSPLLKNNFYETYSSIM